MNCKTCNVNSNCICNICISLYFNDHHICFCNKTSNFNNSVCSYYEEDWIKVLKLKGKKK